MDGRLAPIANRAMRPDHALDFSVNSTDFFTFFALVLRPRRRRELAEDYVQGVGSELVDGSHKLRDSFWYTDG